MRIPSGERHIMTCKGPKEGARPAFEQSKCGGDPGTEERESEGGKVGVVSDHVGLQCHSQEYWLLIQD